MHSIPSMFIDFLSKHSSLSPEQICEVAAAADIRHFKKGTLLLREGAISNECYLVLKGCIRSYLIKDGVEKTIEFYTEEQPVSPVCFGKKIPSGHYLECIEDTVATVSSPKHEQEMFNQFPQLVSDCRIMAESMMAHYQSSLADYKSDSAEDRYLRLLKERPGLVLRVPQYQLASYLGIQPESLSRIRKRLTIK